MSRTLTKSFVKASKATQLQKAHAKQEQNNAGGFSFKLDKWKRLDQFLILGSEKGSYYVKEEKLSEENAKNLADCIKEDGKRVVNRVIEISAAGRAPKNTPAIFAMALVAKLGDEEVRKYSFLKLKEVCRIGTHLFIYANFVNQMRGWGAGLRKAIAGWYNSFDAKGLDLQVAKYQNREGWTHKDLFQVGRVTAKYQQNNPELAGIFSFILTGEDSGTPIISGMLKVHKSKDLSEQIDIIRDHRLPFECVPTELLAKKEVWQTLLPNLGLTAILRNLGNMTRLDVLSPFSKELKFVVDKLGNEEQIKRAKLHPMQILVALKTYAKGCGFKGKNTWNPIPQITDVLNDAYYKAFKFVEPTGKNFLLACDVSGSMGSPCAGSEVLTCCEASGALALTVAKTEKNYHFVKFAGADGYKWNTNKGILPLNISPNEQLQSVCKKMYDSNFGTTDCSLPMEEAIKNKWDVDVFIILTDCETYQGKRHAHIALEDYRRKLNKPGAKLIVIGMTSNGFSIANPDDPNMLDIVGFDANIPALIADFARN